MRQTKVILVVTLFLAGAALFWRGQRGQAALRSQTRAAEMHLEVLQSKTEKIRGDLSPAQQAAAAERAARNRAMALLSAARAVQRGETNLERAWAEPPGAWPEWEPESPFVWVPKEVVKQLPITPFESNGTVRPGVAAMLALSEEEADRLSTALRAIVGEYQKLEVAHARLSTNHLERGAGDKVTLVLEPDGEAAARMGNEFDAALRRNLTAQQYDLMHALSRGWASQHLQPESPQPQIYSVVRHPDGTFGVSTRRGYESSSMSGGSNLEMYLPKHLLPFFEELTEEAPPGKSGN